jgi:hypothetical protein
MDYKCGLFSILLQSLFFHNFEQELVKLKTKDEQSAKSTLVLFASAHVLIMAVELGHMY